MRKIKLLFMLLCIATGAMAQTLEHGVTAGSYYTIKCKSSDRHPNLYNDNWRDDNPDHVSFLTTDNNVPSSLKNNFVWKVTNVDGNNLTIVNGQGTSIKTKNGSTMVSIPTVTVSNITDGFLTLKQAGTEYTYLNASNGHPNQVIGNTRCPVAWNAGTSKETDETNMWKFTAADMDFYELVIVGAPEGTVITRSNGEKAVNGGFFVNSRDGVAPAVDDFTVPTIDGYTTSLDIDQKIITVTYTIQSNIHYTLTDQAGNTYTGSKPGTPGNNATLDDVRGGFTLSDIVWDGDNVTATITFPIPVSNADGATNWTFISSYTDNNHKWYADGTSVKERPGVMPTPENVMSHMWAIYPEFADGAFTFTIKNAATEKYIHSTSETNSHAEGIVTLQDNSSALTLDGNQFKLSTGKYLSIGSSTSDNQILGTYSSHNGTHNNFPTIGYNLTISEVDAATLYTPFAVTIPEGVTAKYIKAAGNSTGNNGTLYYTPLEEGVIPANTAVVLLGEAGEKTFTATTEEVSAISDNILFGYSSATAALGSEHEGVGATGTVYALGNNEGTAVFGHFTGANYKAGKAYLDVATLPGTPSNVRYFYIFDEDMETGIDNIEGAENSNAAIYDMSGRRVSKASKGIYIINGKKVIR